MSQSTTVAAPVSIISPTHAIGVAMVISQAILALLLLAGVAVPALLLAGWSVVGLWPLHRQVPGAITSPPPPEGVVGGTYVHQFTSTGLSPA